MLLLFCVITFVAGVASEGCHFGYVGDHGKDKWGDSYEKCLGKHQSPINIDSEHVNFTSFPPFKMNNFDATAEASLTNNGHTAMMSIDTGAKPTISGGPLGDAIYEFVQLHFHWGSNDTCGGENEINNKQYPLELHAVFFKKEYGCFDSALEYPDGLTVLGCLYEIAGKGNKKYNELLKTMQNITTTNSVGKIDNPPALFDLMPRCLSSYFTYNGSLTTPPCSESVIWIDFDQTVKISHEQLQVFRSLTDGEGEPMVNNFRAIQPLGDRVVFYCKGEETDDSSLLKKTRKIISRVTDKVLQIFELLTSLL